MKSALLKDNELLADIRATDPGDGIALWWLGQSGFLVKHRDRHLLFDPYLSDSLTRKYADTDKPHVRVTEQVVDPARLDFIDVVTSSHNHTDHLDAETLQALAAANPDLSLVLPAANETFARERLGAPCPALLSIDDGSTCEAAGFHFTGIPAAHNDVDRDDRGRCHYLGFLVRFGNWTVYHSGDTLLHEGLLPALAEQDIDLMLLPINGNKPERRVAGNLDGREAAELARQCGAKMVIPCHYDLFEFNTASPELFVESCQRVGQPHAVLRNGERWTTTTLPG